MMFKLLQLLVFVNLFFSLEYSVAESGDSMVFSKYISCSGSACPEFILAQGKITKDTPKDFEKFLKKIDYKPVVYFDSLGGNLMAGLKLGKIIRREGLDTGVYREYEYFKFVNHEEKLFTITNSARCYSACTFAFLGGVSRSIGDKAEFGVHQFYSDKEIQGDDAQELVAILSIYLQDMGVDRAMLDIASFTDSSDMTTISKKLAIQMNIDNTSEYLGTWKLEASNEGNVYTCAKSSGGDRRQKGVLCLIMTQSDLLLAVYSFSLVQDFRYPEKLREIAAWENKNKRVMVFVGDDFVYVNTNGWKLVKHNHYETSFLINRDLLDKILSVGEFKIMGAFASAVRDVEPRTTFSTTHLKKNIRAIMK